MAQQTKFPAPTFFLHADHETFIMSDGTLLTDLSKVIVAYKGSNSRMLEGKSLLNTNKKATSIELTNSFSELIPFEAAYDPTKHVSGWAILDRKYIVAINNDLLYDAFKLGKVDNGIITAPLVYGISGTTYGLTVVGSNTHALIVQEEKALIKKSQVVRADDFVYGGIYKNINGDQFLYLGQVMVPDIEVIHISHYQSDFKVKNDGKLSKKHMWLKEPLDFAGNLDIHYGNLVFYKKSSLIATKSSVNIPNQHTLIEDFKSDVAYNVKLYQAHNKRVRNNNLRKYNNYNEPIVENIQARGDKIDNILSL